MLFKREKRGRGWLINEACRKARATNDCRYFMNEFANAQKKKKIIQPLHKQRYGSGENLQLEYCCWNLPSRQLALRKMSYRWTSLEKVSPPLRPRTLNDKSPPFLSVGISLAPGRTRFWIFMTPIWALENKLGLGLHLLGGSSISTGLLRCCCRVVTPEFRSTHDFWHFALLGKRCDSIAVKTFLGFLWPLSLVTRAAYGGSES